MAKKKRRARAKKANPKKRAAHRRKKRANPAPKRRRRVSHRRRASSRPRRVRRAHARRARKNPGRRRSSARRRSHRRNPGPVAQAAIGLAAGAAAFVLTDVATYFATSDMAKDGQRNRRILGALAVAGGLYLSRSRPLLGLGVAAGGLLSGFGNTIMLAVLRLLPAKEAPRISGYQQLQAVAYDNMQAVAYDNMQAVAYDNLAGWEQMGDPVPAAPWESENPF
jgi:hypothetical protein